MVDVEWDFLGVDLDKEAAERAVSNVLTFYKQALGGITCPIHSREPWLRVQGRTLPSLAVSIEACCGELLERATTRVGEVARRSQD
jgi:hypothetical protein